MKSLIFFSEAFCGGVETESFTPKFASFPDIRAAELSIAPISSFSLPFKVIVCVSGYHRRSISSDLNCLAPPPGQHQPPSAKFNISYSTNFCKSCKDFVQINLPLLLNDTPCRRLISGKN
jgi:hypothetical protein